jgi:hypothetical protein
MYKVKNNETIVDVCLNSTGSLSSWESILNLNGFENWNPLLYNGQELQVPLVVNNFNYTQLQQYPVNNFENFDATQLDSTIEGSLLYILKHVSVTKHDIYPQAVKQQIYTVSQGETIVDVILNATGTLDNWETILNANGFTDWNPTLYVGQEIIIEYLDLQNNNIIQFLSYPLNNDSGINDLDEQISNLISNFDTTILFDNDYEEVEFDDDLTLAEFN